LVEGSLTPQSNFFFLHFSKSFFKMALPTLAKTFDKFSDVNSTKSSWNVKGKVIRLWVVKDFNRNVIPFSVEMILMDSEVEIL
jgi:hypothetical protein